MTHEQIPESVRQEVWNTYIGDHIGKTKCVVCEQTDISPFQFHCRHVIAKSKNGTCDASNLRPICYVCNQSMTTQDMMEFAQKFHPKSRVHQTFKKNKENKSISVNNSIQYDLEKVKEPYVVLKPTMKYRKNNSDAEIDQWIEFNLILDNDADVKGNFCFVQMKEIFDKFKVSDLYKRKIKKKQIQTLIERKFNINCKKRHKVSQREYNGCFVGLTWNNKKDLILNESFIKPSKIIINLKSANTIKIKNSGITINNENLSPIKENQKKRKTIPKIVREKVWKTYINTLQSECLVCNDKLITAFDFECGHVDANGEALIENLRPICRLCNSSMGRENMKTFAEKYFPEAKVLSTFN